MTKQPESDLMRFLRVPGIIPILTVFVLITSFAFALGNRIDRLSDKVDNLSVQTEKIINYHETRLTQMESTQTDILSRLAVTETTLSILK